MAIPEHPGTRTYVPRYLDICHTVGNHNLHASPLKNQTCHDLEHDATVYVWHIRRIELEDKAKVVASVWGAEFVQFLAALAVLPWSI